MLQKIRLDQVDLSDILDYILEFRNTAQDADVASGAMKKLIGWPPPSSENTFAITTNGTLAQWTSYSVSDIPFSELTGKYGSVAWQAEFTSALQGKTNRSGSSLTYVSANELQARWHDGVGYALQIAILSSGVQYGWDNAQFGALSDMKVTLTIP